MGCRHYLQGAFSFERAPFAHYDLERSKDGSFTRLARGAAYIRLRRRNRRHRTTRMFFESRGAG